MDGGIRENNMEKTRENILKIAKDFGFSEDAFLKMIKRQKINGAFDVEKWDKYMIAITSHVSCKICNGPQRRVWPSKSYLKRTDYCVCLTDRRHSIRYTLFERFKSNEKERIEWVKKSLISVIK